MWCLGHVRGVLGGGSSSAIPSFLYEASCSVSFQKSMLLLGVAAAREVERS